MEEVIRQNSKVPVGNFSNHFIKRWMVAALFLFFLASIFGTLMRVFFVVEIPFLDYRNILNAHSHVALLGWGFLLVGGAMLFLLVGKSPYRKFYRWILTGNFLAGLGMAIFFTYQGYGPVSIAFSTLHLLTAYSFAWFFLRDLKTRPFGMHRKFTRWAIYWMVISSLGLWAIAPVSAYLGKAHLLYYSSIQFFLHFQFNGWFTYAILALLIQYFGEKGKNIHISTTSFWILQISLLLTYALSITFSTPEDFLFYLNSLGVILQAIAFYLIFKSLFSSYNPFRNVKGLTNSLVGIGIASLLLKVAVQMAVSIPTVAEISYTIRNYVIGFIHLIMLGSVTLTGVALLLEKSLLPKNQTATNGWIILTLAFILMEFVLFSQGTLLWMKFGFVPYYYEIILGVTLLFPVGLTFLLMSFRKSKFEHHDILTT